MTRRHVYDFDVEGPVQAEVFVLWLDDASIKLTGPCGPEAWYIELGGDDDPVDTVTRLVRSNVGEPVAHPREPGRQEGTSRRLDERAERLRTQALPAPALKNQVLRSGVR